MCVLFKRSTIIIRSVVSPPIGIRSYKTYINFGCKKAFGAELSIYRTFVLLDYRFTMHSVMNTSDLFQHLINHSSKRKFHARSTFIDGRLCC